MKAGLETGISTERAATQTRVGSPQLFPSHSSFSTQILLVIQFLFGLAATIPSPYFNHAIRIRFTSLTASQAGLIFGLPHLIYLAASKPATRFIESRYTEFLTGALALQSIALLGQGQATSIPTIIFWRLVMGISMTAAFISIHGMISNVSRPSNAGRLFGLLECCVKLSAVLGGLIASIGFEFFGSQSLFFISSTVFMSSSLYLAYQSRFVTKERII